MAAGRVRSEILVVDDHPMTRFGIVQLLKDQPDVVVTGEARNAPEALEIIRRRRIALAIVDISLPGRNGLELIKDALALRTGVKILICSMHDELLYGERSLRAGAHGFIMKDEGGQALLQAVREVLHGRIFASPRLASRAAESGGRNARPDAAWPVERLSDRELEIFTFLGQGRRSSEIAALLNLSIKTVDTHRANMREKLSLPNGAALTYYATNWVAAKR